MTVLIIVLVVAVLVLAIAGFVVSGTVRSRRGRQAELKEGPSTAPPAPTAEERAAPTGGVAAPPGPADRMAPPAGVGVAEEDLAEEGPGEDAGDGTAVAAPERPRLRDRIGKARSAFGDYVGSLRKRGRVDDTTWDELEETLILADAGLPTTTRILDDLRARARNGELADPDAVIEALRADLAGLFDGDDRALRHEGDGAGEPDVWLFVGVNGVGKTTTIGKIAAREAAEGRKVVLAAGDTFRAAAGEQLETWADRSGARLIRGADGADPSSVIFDAVQHAAARKADIVLADTAGRLHTKINLMEELRKVRRVASREPARLSEVLLVIDATTGQNGLNQARQFTEAVGVTGVVLTKLDGTAKGGIVLAIRSELGLPIKLVGLGEHIEDLVEFDPDEFVDALLAG